MPVTLRRDLFDRQACCYYINEAFEKIDRRRDFHPDTPFEWRCAGVTLRRQIILEEPLPGFAPRPPLYKSDMLPITLQRLC